MRQISLLLASVCSALLSIAPATAQTVGVSAAVNQNARGIRPGAGVRTIVLGDNVVYNERIETDPVGLLQILLADGTAFTVGPNSAISLDRFVYDPAAGTAEVTASLTKGVFRFIGGKTSKTPNGVTLNTPVGTIGIRGGMADIKSSQTVVEVRPIFGKATVTTGKGNTVTILPGFKGTIVKNGDGGYSSDVRKATADDAKSANAAFSSDSRENGGAKTVPTEDDVSRSQLADSNSNESIPANTPIPSTTRVSEPDRTASQEREVIFIASTDTGRSDVVETAAENVVPAPALTPGPIAIPIPTPRSIAILLVTAGSTYVTNSGDVIPNPGSVGLVGGSDEDDRLATLSQPDGSTSATATTNRGDLVLPVYSDGSFTVRSVPLDGTATLGGIPLAGTVYSGAGDFAVYALGLDGDPTRPVYALAGTPVADTSVFNSRDLRTYSFSRDMLQNIPVPFMRAGALGTDYSQASIGDLYVLEGDGQAAAPLSLQSWLMIDGTGGSQRSGIGVNIGELFLDETDSLQIAYGRRGSFRAEPLGFSSELGGTVATFGPVGSNKFYGTNGEYFGLAGQPYLNDFFSDNDAFQNATERFSTVHVFNLENEIPEVQFLADRGNGQSLASGGGRTISGYATGLIEVGRSDGSYTQVLANSDAGGGQPFITFNDADNTLGGEFSIADDAGTNVLSVAFGNGTGGNTVNGRSAYIDDGLFAATNNNNRDRNTLIQDDNGTTTTYRQVQGGNPRTYVISGDANPIPNFIPNGKLCDCEFLEWGWWGTQITARNNADPDTVRAGVHLGTWAAGDITTTSQLATSQLANVAGSATYTGRIVGNVSVPTAGGKEDYVATGAMSMSYDFSQRSGNMTITNFDNRDFAGSVFGATGATSQAEGVAVNLSQTNLAQDAQGDLQGLFVNDGSRVAAGLIGQVELATPTPGWSAVGIAAASRP